MMHRSLLLLVCLLTSCAITARGQSSGIAPVQIAAGTVLTFHLQTRLKSGAGDALDAFPKGTVLRVRLLDSVDSAVNHDGDAFHGSIVSPLVSGDQVVIHPKAEAHGLLVLLRSQSHPEGFCYELLLTGLVDHGQSYVLTASLDSLVADGNSNAAPNAKADMNDAIATTRPSVSHSSETTPN
jgi:hypothetical protein